MTVKDTEEIIDSLKAGKKPRAGPRYVFIACVPLCIVLFVRLIYYLVMAYLMIFSNFLEVDDFRVSLLEA